MPEFESAHIDVRDFDISTMSAVFSNIDAEHTSKFDSNAKVEYFYDSTKYFEGEIDTVEYSPHRINITASSYGSQLQRLDASPQSYHVEPGRTITIADVLSGFPYQHGGVKEFDVEPDESIWDLTDATGTSRDSTKYNSAPYSWKIQSGGISKKIYVDSSLYDKIKISLWCNSHNVTTSCKTKSSSEASYTIDSSTESDAWEHLEVLDSLVSGDTYFDADIALESTILYGYINTTDHSATTDGMVISLNSYFKDYINLTGNTYVSLISDRTTSQTVPTGFEQISVDSPKASNTTTRPNLYIAYTSVGSGDGDTTIYASETGGYLLSDADNYDDSYAGTSITKNESASKSTLIIGQRYFVLSGPTDVYRIIKSYITFDTSTLPDDAIVTTANLNLTGASDYSTTDFNVYVTKWDFDTSFSTDDWSSGEGYSYIDDFTYCLHYKDDDASVWDNGILARTKLTDTNVSCDIAIDSFEVGQSEKKQSVIERLMEQSEGYEWKVDPANKDFYFREFPVTANTTEIAVGANTTDIRPQRDFTELWNDVYVNGHPPGEDWQEVYTDSDDTNNITAIAVIDEETIIIGTYKGSGTKGTLLISTDGGSTFTLKHTLNANGDYVFNLWVDFENEIVYAMCTGSDGILKLTKGSGTWSSASWATEDADIKFGSEIVKLTKADGTEYYFIGGWGITADKKYVYRKQGTGGSWSTIFEAPSAAVIPAICGVNDTLIAGVNSGAAVAGGVYRCVDPFVASPTFTKKYDAVSYVSGYDGEFYGAIAKLNYQTLTTDFYLGYISTGDVANVLKSSDDGLTWAINDTFDDANDWIIQNMRENDGVVYAVIRADISNSKYGRIVKTDDEGTNWSTDYLGEAGLEFYALDTYGAKVYCSIADATDGIYSLHRKQDNYTVSAHYEDATSITAYGRRTKILDTNQVYSYDEALRFAQTICNTYKDPKITIYADLVFSPDLEVSKTIRYVQAVPTTRCHSPVKTGDDAGLLGSYNLYEASHYVPEMRTSVTANNNRESVSTLISKLVKKKVSDIKQIGEGIVTAYDSDSKTASVYSPQTFTTIFGIRVIPTSVSEGDRVLIGYPSSQTGTPIIVGVIQTI